MISNRQYKDEKSYLTQAVLERALAVEAAEDYALPDYQCEIRRILYVSAAVLPPVRYQSATGIDFGGTVDYKVTYIGGDGELYCVPLSSEYSFSLPLDASVKPADVLCLCSVRPESVSTRVSAPRHLSVRCRLRPFVRVLMRTELGTEVSAEIDAEQIFRRVERAERLECESVRSEPLPLECILPPLEDDVRIVSARAGAVVSGCEYGEDGVLCRGRITLRLLRVSDTGEFSRETKLLDFCTESDVSLDNACLYGTAEVSDVSVSVSDECVKCSLLVISEVTAMASTEEEYVADAYACGRRSECVSEEISVRALAACFCGNCSVSERVSPEVLGMSEGDELIDAFGSVQINDCEWNERDGKYLLSGTASVTVLWRHEGEIGAGEVSFPVRYEQPAREGEPHVCFDVRATLDGLSVRALDGELCIEGELILCGDCLAERRVRYASALEVGEETAERGGCLLRVCYPEPDDTLWSVAKRYRVSPSCIRGVVGEEKYVLLEES